MDEPRRADLDFLEALEARGVLMRVLGDQLSVDAPAGVISQEIATEIRERKPSLLEIVRERAEATTTIRTQPRDRPLRLGVIQQRMWLHSVLEPETVLYHLPAAWRFRGTLDRRALHAAFSRIVERQEALRTVIDASGKEPVMTFTAPEPFAIPVLDLSDVPADRQEAEMVAVFERKRDEPFDFAAGPLYKVLLVVCGPTDHVLFFMPHHVIWDGWSFDIFLRELAELYAAEAMGRSADLPTLPAQYADYAAWHREWIAEGQVDDQIRYWEKKLGGSLPVLDLPTTHPRPAYFTHRGHWEPFRLDEELTAGLKALARSERSTLVMVLLAAWNALLYRYTGQTDILIGAPIQNRMLPEAEGLIGAFVNTVVLRCEVSPTGTFRELLHGVRETSIDAFSHQEVPVEMLIERLMRERSTSHTPLFQVMFSHQQIVRRPEHFADLALSQVHVNPAASAVDLTFAVMEEAEAVRAVIHYSTDLYDAIAAQRFCRHLANLLRSAVADPEQSIGDLAMLDDGELEELTAWGTGPAVALPDAGVQDLISARVAETPGRVAVKGEDGAALTYAELEDGSTRLARELHAQGIGRGDVVGVSLPRTPDLVVALLAVFKAGGAYLPLDPDFPAERLRFVMQDAGMAGLISTDSVLEGLPKVVVPVFRVVGDRGASGHGPVRGEGPVVGPSGAAAQGGDASSGGRGEDLAYLIYTSGSTGTPKGVEVTHRNAVNLLLTMAERPGISDADTLLAVTTLSFDISVLEIFGPLVAGGTVVLASSATTGDGPALRRLLEESDATVVQATPATWRMLLAAGWAGQSTLKALVGGEALPETLARELSSICGEVWNMYGPTETTVWSTCDRVAGGDGPVRIGTPIGNTHVYVLDEQRRRVPAGVPGELYIGGAGVTRGYRGRADFSRERFVPDLFLFDPPGPEREARMYRTGDLVRFDAEGRLEYLRRLDDQVKVRGFRIELGEIESVLETHGQIRQGVVRAFAPGTPDARLVAYVVFAPGADLTASDVRRYLGDRLPLYMVPGFVMEVDDIPRTPNGKLDRNALNDPLDAGAHSWGQYQEPETRSEVAIAQVWTDLLGVERVGRQDNFFELGGHSLLSIQAVSAIEDQTGRRLDPRAFFFQNVEQLGERLDREDSSAV